MEDTFPKLLLRNAERFGDGKVALREKKLGIWQEVTWRRYLDDVRTLSLGLVEIGLKRGETVAMIGSNRREWFELALAVQAAGGVVVALFQDELPSEVIKVLKDTGATIIVAEDQEQIDKILEIRGQIPGLRRVIYYIDRGMEYYQDEHLLGIEKLLELGRQAQQQQSDLFEANLRLGSENDPAVIAYTSGLTGEPRGITLSYRSILKQVENWRSIDDFQESDEYVSFVSPGNINELLVAIGLHQACGFTVNFPESEETVADDLREIGPHLVVAPPRFWELIISQVHLKIEEAGNLKKSAYNNYMPGATKSAADRLRKGGRAVKPSGLGNFLVARPIRDSVGLLRTRHAYNFGGPVADEVMIDLHALGVPLRQIYGVTETAGIATMHRPDDIRLDSVGTPLPDMEVRIAENGEILLRSPALGSGFEEDEASKSVAADAGWVRTGDAGRLTSDNQLQVVDRLGAVLEMTDGTRYSASGIETRLKTSPYVNQAVVIGQNRPYVAALIAIDAGTVGKWAEQHNENFNGYTELSQLESVYNLLRSEVERVNENLPEAARIQRYILLHRPLSADEGELTRTMLVRRSVVEERYRPLIEALYGKESQTVIPTEIRYADGRVVQSETAVRVASLTPEFAEAR